MKYRSHEASLRDGKIGVLLTNLGTPDNPDTKSVRRYLGEFLWDPRVVEVSRPLWWMILHGIILRTRPARSAAAYRGVWTEEGSPLLTMTKSLGEKLGGALAEHQPDISLAVAMRYGSPSISHGLAQLEREGVERVMVLPLYPQYSATTTASTFDAVTQVLRQWRRIPEVRFINHYHDDSFYLDCLAQAINDYRERNGGAERLLMSFHGIPQRYADQGDPYGNQCLATARRLARRLSLEAGEWRLTFQSRFGREPWLTPYTDATLKEWGASGVGSVQVVCPGFAVDCLETIEEIGEENRDYFLEAGGKEYRYIPALNDRQQHVDMLCQLVIRHCGGWL